MRSAIRGRDGTRLDVRVVGDGSPLVLLHGFPDHGGVWDELVPLLRPGRQLWIPDLRGFRSSDRPSSVDAYALANAVDDVLALLDATGARGTPIIGHDWGGLLAWHAAARAPERIPWIVSLAAPHPNAFEGASLEQRRRSWYVFLFCLSGMAEGALRSSDWALFRAFVAEGGMPQAVIEERIRTLAQPGALTAALSWYRANLPIPTSTPCTVPSLVVHGAHDPYVLEEVMRTSGRHASGPHRFEVLASAGHWMPETHPSEVAAIVESFRAGVTDAEPRQ